MTTLREAAHQSLIQELIDAVSEFEQNGLACKPDRMLAARAALSAALANEPQAEPGSVLHSLGGFIGHIAGMHGREPTLREVWDAAIRSYRDLQPAAAQALTDEHAVAIAWNAVRAEARALKGAGNSIASLLAAVEQYGDRLAGAAPAQPIQAAAEGYPLVEAGRYQLICANGCGRCGIKLSEFECERTETLAGELVSRKVCPQIVSACCGHDVEVWDEEAQDNMPHKIMAVTVDQLYAPPATTMENLRAEIDSLTGQRDQLLAFSNMVKRHQREEPDVWYWQNDGKDHLESMVHKLPVVILAEQLRGLLAAATKQEGA